MKKTSLIQNVLLGIITIFLAYNCFWNIGEKPLERWDEKVYIDVIKSSIQDNSYIAPKIKSLEGEFDMLTFNNNYFYEKPPLWLWISFVITNIFGFNSDYLRYISSFSGFLTGLLLIFISSKYFNKWVGIISGLLFATTSHLFIMNLVNTFSSHNIKSINLDILQILFITLSQVFILKYLNNYKKNKKLEVRSRNILILIGILVGLGVMAKGIYSIVPVALLFAHLILFEKEKLKSLFPQILIICLSAAIIIAPWHIYMTFHDGWNFWKNYLFYHNINRSFFAIEGHEEAWYFHITNFFNPEFFTSGLVFFLTVQYLIIKRQLSNPVIFHFISFTLLSLIFATFVQTKLSWYALYIYPGACIISAFGYWKFIESLKVGIKSHSQ